jgi:prepilin peptidase CpaA
MVPVSFEADPGGISLAQLNTTVFACLMVAVIGWDLKTQRIPNALTMTGLAVGLLLRAAMGAELLLWGLAGAGLAFLISVPLFAMGGMGGGDAKLIMAAGAFLGPGDLITAILIAAVLGGLMGVIEAARRGVLLPVLLNAKNMMVYAITLGRAGEGRSLESPNVIAVPYGIAIALGCLAVWFFPVLTEVL